MSINDAMQEYVRYAKGFDLKNPEVMARFHHTFRIVEYAKDIARSIGLVPKDINLAMLCALLIDIGRYRQYEMYKTFIDAKSFDHAMEGYNILKYNNYIAKYTKDTEEQEIVLKAVRNHNKYTIEDGLTERELLFAKIARDADKLDIMMEQGNTINGIIVLNAKYIKPFQEQRLYKNEGVTGEYELTLRTLAFVYDFNFKYSYEFVKENNIIDKKIDLIMAHSSSLGILDYLKKIITEYVDNRIKELS